MAVSAHARQKLPNVVQNVCRLAKIRFCTKPDTQVY